ncbi:hypothetical protein Efla_005038 [Eimeria flavescens]
MPGRWDVGPPSAWGPQASAATWKGPHVGKEVGVPPPTAADCTYTPASSLPAPKYSHAYTLRDTSMRINGLCFSSDGSLLFLSSWDCSLHIHDVRRCVSVRSLHAHRHGVESVYVLPTSNHLCLCPTKLQGPPQPSKPEKPHQQQPVGGPLGGGAPQPPAAPLAGGGGGAPSEVGPPSLAGKQRATEGVGGPSLPSWGAPPTLKKEGGSSYNLRLWDLRENRYVRVIPVTGRVIPGTGVCVHPKKTTFFCCTDDGFVKYFCSEKETYMWRKQTKTKRPLAAIDREGLVAALYEGDGLLTISDLNELNDPFCSFSISPYLQQQQQQQEIPTSLMFCPDGALLLLGTDRGRLLAFDSFTGAPAAVWAPPGGPSVSSSPRESEGGPFLSAGGDPASSSSSSSSSVCSEGFIPAVDPHTETLLCGSTDGWVYGYSLRQAQQGASGPGSLAVRPLKGGPQEGASPCPEAAELIAAAAATELFAASWSSLNSSRSLRRAKPPRIAHRQRASLHATQGPSFLSRWGPRGAPPLGFRPARSFKGTHGGPNERRAERLTDR